MTVLRRAEASLFYMGAQALTLNSTATGLNSTVTAAHVSVFDISAEGGGGLNYHLNSTGPIVGAAGGITIPSGSVLRLHGLAGHVGDLKFCKRNSTACYLNVLAYRYVGEQAE